ncbi:MAG: hypothetical protein JNJ57_05595 [Saprospiraceae bacterium]|nr:hypothetical protein [Saprospiraceae bacterium]
MMFRLIFLLIICTLLSATFRPMPEVDGVYFIFKGTEFHLKHPLKKGHATYFPHAGHDNAQLDTLSNWFSPSKSYVEFIRQDDPIHPALGLALGFEFDETNGEYPYMPAHAAMQLKNFAWGGVEFSRRDTLNYTGVSNDVSDDIQVEIDGFQNDTIWGRFNGVIVSGAGVMSEIQKGYFKIKVHRID